MNIKQILDSGYALIIRGLLIVVLIIGVGIIIASTIQYFFCDLPWVQIFINDVKIIIAMSVYAISGFALMIIFYFLSKYVLSVSKRINHSKMKPYFINKNPSLYIKLLTDLGDHLQYVFLFYGAYTILGIITPIVFIFGDFNHLTIAIAVTQFILFMGFYINILIKYRKLGRHVFYQARKFMLPYLILLMPILIVGTFAFLSLNYLVVEAFKSFDVENMLRYLWYLNDLPSFRDFIGSLLICTFWSFGLSIIIIYTIPIFIKRDYSAIVIIVLVIIAPIVAEIVFNHIDPYSDFLATLIKIPPPVLSLILVLVFDMLYKLINASIGKKDTCAKCGYHLKSTDNFCNACGFERLELNKSN